jgi:sugar phosphate isomerase/epimerase
LPGAGSGTLDKPETCAILADIHNGSASGIIETYKEGDRVDLGVFLILNRGASLAENLRLAGEAGFACADLTYTHSGAAMMERSGLIPSVSLDANPFDVKRMFDEHGIRISSVCAHASLLEPSSPARFGTPEIMRAVRLAAAIGVRDVITTEFYAQSEWARRLSYEQRVTVVARHARAAAGQCRLRAETLAGGLKS